MKTVGEVLKSERRKKRISLIEAEKATKIRQKYLMALEKNRFQSLPEMAFSRGFVKTYASFLGLEKEKILAIFRRDWKQAEEKKVLPQGIIEPLNRKWQFTPSAMIILAVIVFLSLFFTYLFLEAKPLIFGKRVY